MEIWHSFPCMKWDTTDANKNEEHQKEYLDTLRNTVMDLYNASFIPYSEKCLACVFLLNIYLGKAIVRLKKKFRL